MKKPDTILDEVHAIRRKIDEETKHMTPSERKAYFNKAGEEAAKKYDLKRIIPKDDLTDTTYRVNL